MWFRLPVAVFKKYCQPAAARLEFSDTTAALHFPKTPRDVLKYVFQYLVADCKEPTGSDAVKYPKGDIVNIVYLCDAARDLGITTLIEKTGDEIKRANGIVARAANNALGAFPPARGGPRPPGQMVPLTPEQMARREAQRREHWVKLPIEFAAQDTDGYWIVHTRTRLRVLTGADAAPYTTPDPVLNRFEGEMQAIGLLSHVRDNYDLPAIPQGSTSTAVVVVARWRGRDWKIVCPPGCFGTVYD